MFFKSIRFKIILWYTLFLTVTLCAFSAMLYEGFNKVIYNDFDDLLSSRAEGVADSVTAYWRAHRLNLSPGRAVPAVADSMDPDKFIEAANDWVTEKRKDPELMSLFVRILDRNGRLLVSSKSMPRLEPLDEDDLSDILAGEDSFDTIRGESAENKNMNFRVYSKPVSPEKGTVYVIQVAGPARLVYLALGNLRLILFLLLPVTAILAAIPGVVLVRLTLKPVDRMVDTLKQITAENLKLKIHIPDTKDEIKRLADTFNDMIERLERSFSSQQRFIRDISRELEAPLAALKEELEAALEKELPEPEYRTIVMRALKGTGSFSKTIENLMLLSQSGPSHALLEIRKISLSRVVEEAFGEMKSAADEKCITMTLISDGDIKMDGDREQLLQLFKNLMDNAVRYTLRKGRVSVMLRRSANNAVVNVEDTGVGIPEDEITYIFDRFYQAARPRGVRGGFGLGLSNAKSIAQAHRATIAVTSESGKGSVFTVTLPLSYQA
jgi:signal transduction histidine kinase